jgi:hypothetical protein
MPQIWDEHASGDLKIIRLQCIGKFKRVAEQKKAKQAEARKAHKVEASQNVQKITCK